MEETHILSVLVDNTSGVLLRIAGLFSRRGYNISSIAAAETEDIGITRMTIVAHGDDNSLEQIEKQLSKLVDVREIKVVNAKTAVCREHLLLKMNTTDENRIGIIGTANLFDAKIIDSSDTTTTFELTGEHSKLKSFINMMRPYGIRQLVKTGISALERG